MNLSHRISPGRLALLAAILVLSLAACLATARPAHAATWTTCGAFTTWEKANSAWELAGEPRRADADGDGIPCESLAGAPRGDGTFTKPAKTPAASAPVKTPTKACVRTSKTVQVGLSGTKYPNIIAHMERAIKRGFPRVMVLNKPGADLRRDRLLAGIPTKPGYDRDEFPMAFGRATWHADVEYVPSSENRSAGSVVGAKVRRYCDGTRFTITAY